MLAASRQGPPCTTTTIRSRIDRTVASATTDRHKCQLTWFNNWFIKCCWLPCVCLLIAMCVPVDCHVCAFCMPEQLPHMGHFYACSLPCMRILIAISVCVHCHIWACCRPEQLPHMGHFCARWMPCIDSCLPFMYLLIATCGPVVCHICASCLPYVGHMWARQRSHVGHMWALCGPLVECLLGVEQLLTDGCM